MNLNIDLKEIISTCLLATPPNVYSLVITGKRKTTMIVMFVIMKKRKGVAFIFGEKFTNVQHGLERAR